MYLSLQLVPHRSIGVRAVMYRSTSWLEIALPDGETVVVAGSIEDLRAMVAAFAGALDRMEVQPGDLPHVVGLAAFVPGVRGDAG